MVSLVPSWILNGLRQMPERLAHYSRPASDPRAARNEYVLFSGHQDHDGVRFPINPSLFFTTVVHDIYHTPFDEPSRIEYPKLTRMAKWMYATGWAVSETRERPAIDSGYKFSR